MVTRDNLKHMDVNTFKAILEKLSSQPVREAKLMGLGEPFFHPQYAEICEQFKNVFPKSFLISATNCQYRFTSKVADALEYIDLLYLSIDGYQESYELSRPGSKWSTLIDYLVALNQYYIDNNSRKRGRVEINFVATEENYHSIPQVYELLEKFPVVTDFRINLAQWWGEDKNLGAPRDQAFFDMLFAYRRHIKGKKDWDFKDCWWPFEGLYMTVDGSVKICCLNTSTESVGNLIDDDLNTINSSPKLLDLQKALSRNAQDHPHCKNCSYKTLSEPLAKLI